MTRAEWRASRRVDLRASEAQYKTWTRAARDRSMKLSAWVRLVLDEEAHKMRQGRVG